MLSRFDKILTLQTKDNLGLLENRLKVEKQKQKMCHDIIDKLNQACQTQTCVRAPQ
jgi:hypothetical protein